MIDIEKMMQEAEEKAKKDFLKNNTRPSVHINEDMAGVPKRIKRSVYAEDYQLNNNIYE